MGPLIAAGLFLLLAWAPAQGRGEPSSPALCSNLTQIMLDSQQCNGILSSVVRQPDSTCTLSAFGACFEQGRYIPDDCSPDKLVDYDPSLAATL